MSVIIFFDAAVYPIHQRIVCGVTYGGQKFRQETKAKIEINRIDSFRAEAMAFYYALNVSKAIKGKEIVYLTDNKRLSMCMSIDMLSIRTRRLLDYVIDRNKSVDIRWVPRGKNRAHNITKINQ